MLEELSPVSSAQPRSSCDAVPLFNPIIMQEVLIYPECSVTGCLLIGNSSSLYKLLGFFLPGVNWVCL